MIKSTPAMEIKRPANTGYKTFIPDSMKQGHQKKSIGKSNMRYFSEETKLDISNGSSDLQPIRTLEFIREKVMKGLNFQ